MIVLHEEPKKRSVKWLSDLIFQHHSPKLLNVLVPQTYESIYDDRSQTMNQQDAVTYVTERFEEEKTYKKLLAQENMSSFTYATIVGFNKMESAMSYPGFTYYFKLQQGELDKCLFGIIKDNKTPSLKSGALGLIEALNAWNKHSHDFKIMKDNILGIIEPRVEVIIATTVTPYAMIPEIESRDV